MCVIRKFQEHYIQRHERFKIKESWESIVEDYHQSQKNLSWLRCAKFFIWKEVAWFFEQVKAEKKSNFFFFYRSFIDDLEELSMARVSRFRSPPSASRERSIDLPESLLSPARTGPLPLVSVYRNRYKDPGFFSSRRLSDIIPTGENIK